MGGGRGRGCVLTCQDKIQFLFGYWLLVCVHVCVCVCVCVFVCVHRYRKGWDWTRPFFMINPCLALHDSAQLVVNTMGF